MSQLIIYINNHNMIALIDSGNTYNFIYKRVIEQIQCCVYPIPIFKMMIQSGMIKCGREYENVKLQMCEYNAKKYIFLLKLLVVLQLQGHNRYVLWHLYFRYLNMLFIRDEQKYTLNGLASSSPKIIISHHMQNLSKKCHSNCYTIYWHTSNGNIPMGNSH